MNNRSKPYFPLCLGNGLDSVMVDYSGSMHCDSGHLHLEQHEGAICCWEKVTHREHGRDMVPLVQFPYRLMNHDGELFEVGTFSQRFDPIRSVLTTDIEATIVRMRITTFLTDNSLYVERYQILWTDLRRRPKMVFMARKPVMWMAGLKIPFPDDMKWAFHRKNNSLITGEYSFGEVQGCLGMGVKASSPKKKFLAVSDSQIEVLDLKKGDLIERFIAVQDNSHAADYRKGPKKLIEPALATGGEGIQNSHEKTWRAFQGQTKVKLPDREMEDIYRKSLWMIRASRNPLTGFITSGLYHAFKGGGYACYWDIIFAMRALVTSNQQVLAKRLLDFYQGTADQARVYASQIRRPGAYFPWFANWRGKSLYYENANEMRDIEKFNNNCVAMQLFDTFRFAGDKEDLKTRLPLIGEILNFMIAETVTKKGNHYEIRLMQGGDENIHRRNDTVHLLTLIKALEGYIEGCRTVGVNVEEKLLKLLGGLRKGLKGNFRHGILYDFAGGLDVSSAGFTYQALASPEGVGTKTVRASLKSAQGEWGLTNNGTYRNLIWPWTEGRGALAFSCIDPYITYLRLKNAIRFTSTHGIFPEKIRPDGFWILFGYLTAHTTFVYAVNSLLAADDGQVLTVAAGVPAEWKNLSFENIYTASGYGVSLTVANGKIKKLIVVNCRDRKRIINLRLLRRKIQTIELIPGKNHVI